MVGTTKVDGHAARLQGGNGGGGVTNVERT